jgi:type I restriction enzyme, S subunit
LGDPNVSTLVMGQSPPSNTYNTQMIGLPFFQGKADFGYIHPSPRVWCSEPTRTGRAGDILMSVRAPVGDVNLATEACALGRGVAAIRAAPQSNSIFLYYALQFYKPQLVAASSGAIFESINKAALHDLEIHLPSEPEQEKIAAILWKLQRAIAIQDKLLKATADLKQSAMQRLFTHGLRGEPLKDTEIGPMPESWNPLAVADCVTPYRFDRDRQLPKSAYQRAGKWPVVDQGQSEVAGYTDDDDKVHRSAVPIIIFGDHSRTLKYLTQPFVLGADGTKPLLAKGNINAAFLFYALQHLDIPSKGYSRHYKYLAESLIAIPSDTREQGDIATILSTLDRKLAHHRRKRAALDALFQTTLHQLMTVQVRVADLDIDTSDVASPLPDARTMIVEGEAGVPC